MLLGTAHSIETFLALPGPSPGESAMSTSPSRLSRPVSPTVFWRVLIAVTLGFFVSVPLAAVLAEPGAAEIDDAPQTFWGVSNVAPGTTTNVQSEVWAIEQIGNTIYVGGKFLNVKGGATEYDQPYLAAFHADTGRWIDWWRPELNGPVYALKASSDGSKLFVGGEFTAVEGQTINAFAALDPASGDPLASWTARLSGGGPAVVRDIDIAGDDLYLAGSFTTAANNGVQNTVFRAVRMSQTTGTIDTAWRPSVEGGGVWGIAASPDAGRVYLTGFFTSVNGDPNAAWAAILDDQTGAPVPGLAHISNNTTRPYQHDVVVANGLVFIGGSQHNVNVYRESDFELVRSHLTRNGGDIQDMEVVGDRVYVSCHCWNWNYDHTEMQIWPSPDPAAIEHDIRGVFALDATTGAHDPDFFVSLTGSAGPWAIHGNVSDGCLWVGGDLTTSAGSPVDAFTRLCDSNGPGPAAGPQLTPPAPLSCSAVAVNNSSIELSWSAVDFATAYVVYRDGQWIDRVDDPNQTSYVDVNVTPGVNYSYTVATNGGGNNSDPLATCSNGVGVSVLPVLSCTAVEQDGSIQVLWTRDNANDPDNADRFVVARSRNGGAFNTSGAVNAPGLEFVDGSVSQGNTYAYTVTAANGSAQAPATACTPSITIAVPGPVAPAQCSSSANGGTIDIDWTRANNDNAEAFTIRRSKNGGPFYWAARLNVPATSWADGNVSAGNNYAYRIETVSNGIASVPTSCGAVSIAGAGVQAVASCSASEAAGGITVSWVRANNDNANVFRIYRSRDGGPFFWAGKVDAPGLELMDTNVANGSSYTYRVRAVGATSSAADITCSPSVTFTGSTSTDPIAPVSCSVSVAGNNVTVDWVRANNDNAVSFTVRRSRNGGTLWWAGRVDAPGTSFVNTGVGSGSYTYTVETRIGSEASSQTLCTPNPVVI